MISYHIISDHVMSHQPLKLGCYRRSNNRKLVRYYYTAVCEICFLCVCACVSDSLAWQAFAMQLAEGLMRDAAAGRGEAVGLDDEDPDMDGWSDMDDDDDDNGDDDDVGEIGDRCWWCLHRLERDA